MKCKAYIGLSLNKLLGAFRARAAVCGASVSPSLTIRAFFFADIELLAHPAHLRGSWMVGLLAGLDHIMVGGLMTARRLAYLGGSSYARPPLLLAVAWALVLPTRYWASGVPFWHNIPELDCHPPGACASLGARPASLAAVRSLPAPWCSMSSTSCPRQPRQMLF